MSETSIEVKTNLPNKAQRRVDNVWVSVIPYPAGGYEVAFFQDDGHGQLDASQELGSTVVEGSAEHGDIEEIADTYAQWLLSGKTAQEILAVETAQRTGQELE